MFSDDIESYRQWKRMMTSPRAIEWGADHPAIQQIETWIAEWEAEHPNARPAKHGRPYRITLANGCSYEFGSRDGWSELVRAWADKEAATLETAARKAERSYSGHATPGQACRAYAARLLEAAALLRKPIKPPEWP